MTAVTLNGTGLTAVIVVVIAFVIVVVIVSRIIAHDREIRIARVGWFVERERFSDQPSQELELPTEHWPAPPEP